MSKFSSIPIKLKLECSGLPYCSKRCSHFAAWFASGHRPTFNPVGVSPSGRTSAIASSISGLASHGLIAPLRFHDGEHFPLEAQAVQQMDVSPYTSTLQAFWTSPKALELEDSLKSFHVKSAG
jgi:hypothetical protein